MMNNYKYIYKTFVCHTTIKVLSFALPSHTST